MRRTWFARRLAIVIALSSGWLGGPDRASAVALHLENRTSCLDEPSRRARLGDLLAAYTGGAHGSVTVVANPGEGATVLTLRIVTLNGEIVLDRRFDLKAQDCPSAVELLATVLDTFLRELPRDSWGEGPVPARSPERVVVTADMSEVAGMVFAAVDSRWSPTSADAEIGAAIDVGSTEHRLAGSVTARVGYPHALGGGRYLESLAMLGLGWRYGQESWMVRAEIRTGGLLVSGFGYANNGRVWLLWLEAQAAALWCWQGLLIGPELGLSPLRDHIRTGTGFETEVPWLRAGLVVAIPFWSDKM